MKWRCLQEKKVLIRRWRRWDRAASVWDGTWTKLPVCELKLYTDKVRSKVWKQLQRCQQKIDRVVVTHCEFDVNGELDHGSCCLPCWLWRTTCKDPEVWTQLQLFNQETVKQRIRFVWFGGWNRKQAVTDAKLQFDSWSTVVTRSSFSCVGSLIKIQLFNTETVKWFDFHRRQDFEGLDAETGNELLEVCNW